MYQFTFSTDDPRLLARILELVTPSHDATEETPADWPLTAIKHGWTPPEVTLEAPTPSAPSPLPDREWSEEDARRLQNAYCEKFGLVKFRDLVYAAGVKRLGDLAGPARAEFFRNAWTEIEAATEGEAR